VIMTALAMIIGMVPWRWAWATRASKMRRWTRGHRRAGAGDRGDLFVVPVVYVSLRTKLPSKHVMEQRFLAEERAGLDAAAPAVGA